MFDIKPNKLSDLSLLFVWMGKRVYIVVDTSFARPEGTAMLKPAEAKDT